MATAMPGRDETLELISGGAATEIIGGAGAAVLAILGLIGVLSFYATSISAIVVGAALAIEGGAIGGRYRRVMMRTEPVGLDRPALMTGVSAELLGGIAGLVLGILGLIGVDTMVLLPSAAIVFGVTLIFGSGITARLDLMRTAWPDLKEGYQRTAYEGVRSAVGAQILVGLSSAVLGILALIGVASMTLTQVAFLAVGASILLTGLALSTQLGLSLTR